MLYQLSYSRTINVTDSANKATEHATHGTTPANPTPPPEPPVGFEPTTARLRIECSTPELRWHLTPGVFKLQPVEPRGIEPLTSAVRLQRSPI